MCAAFKKEGHKLVESSRTTRVIFHHLCVYCVWRERGEEEIFFFGGDGMVLKGDPGEISRHQQNLKKGL